jgi:hypothetical protein
MDQMHVYSQESYHEESSIVGDRSSLTKLRDAITVALEKGQGQMDSFASDGEGYTTYVILLDSLDQRWNKLVMPYTAEFAKDYHEDRIGPHVLIVRKAR